MKNYRRLIIAFILVFLVACTTNDENTIEPPQSTNIIITSPAQEEISPPPSITPSASPTAETNELLHIYFFDVGQADCSLIQLGEHTMLIDAGNRGDDERVIRYLDELGADRFDYVVATHNHADHIGAMTTIINRYDIDTFLFSDVITGTIITSEMIYAIDKAELLAFTPEVGESFSFGNAVFTILAPNQKYSDLNDSSIVLRLEYGDQSFLFTGDATATSESEQLISGGTLASTVIKVGHHGSDTSTTQNYLTAVQPQIAIIFVGEGNSYGHPTDAVLKRLQENAATIYRTDKNGTIHIQSDGKTLTFETDSTATENEPFDDVLTEEPSANETDGYIGNKNSHVFHVSTCSRLPSEHNRVLFNTRQDYIKDGYRPCQICNP